MPCRHLILILGDQLNHDNPALDGFDAAQDHILMVEAPAEATLVWSHKARIALFLSAMRHFAVQLEAAGLPLTYLKLGAHAYPSLSAAWRAQVLQLQPQKLIVCEPGEYRVLQALEQLAVEMGCALAVRDDTHFMCSRADFKRWAGSNKSLRMEFFYRWMRKRHDVLMEAGEPAGGAWNFDADNRQSFGKRGPQQLPSAPAVAVDAITHDVLADVAFHFPEHPGSLAHFVWPVTRAQALAFLDDFIQHKLGQFGPHQDAMWQSSHGPGQSKSMLGETPGESQQAQATPFLWHSLLSSSLNLKLLDPREVIAAAEQAYRQQRLPLASVEGFIRQVLGWREFIRGVYWLDMPGMASANHYQHQRALPVWYWTGDTHMNCLRQTIGQTLEYGYAHHIQRLMVTGLFGLLAEIDPRQVEAWYLAVYVDAVEWVELPNTAGMALYANGGRFTSKPYVASGAYIKRMSNYCTGCRYKPELRSGPEACPYTTLYWHFLAKHHDTFAANPRTALMAKNFERLDADERMRIAAHADKVLNGLDAL
ncbi:cryptochrome/photolyase family protein [Pseudomethylobacillus aquaticus]|uniref:Cryptochrome/photolyase family protein n=1 Tax=Pseudomethylobacillus aquaticus TaxID=2676064 RepID=A0A3N0V6S6_9PROT|nr:cryptochrome/photolyase family protein [Pseudomethylobacillus aquaticus]ROH88500.1 cryptochrome/photolyase family protein [Pseudomethylobacillus aquaticus]